MIVVSMLVIVFLLIWLQRLIYRRYWNRGLTMEISFSQREASEGDTLTLRETITNRKLLPLPWLVAKFQLSRNLIFKEHSHSLVTDAYYQSEMFSVGMYQRITRRQEFVCAKRGYYLIKSMDLVSSNIFVSEKLAMSVPCDAELTVYPKRANMEELKVFLKQMYGDIEVHRFTNQDPFFYRSIREYSTGDDFRSINFKATAKTGDLMVNVNSAAASQVLVILLNLEEYAAWSSELVFEESIRIAAAVAEDAISAGLSVALYSNGCDAVTKTPIAELAGCGSMHLENILEKLARIDLSQPCESMESTMLSFTAAEPYYLLISANHEKNIAEAYEILKEKDMTVRWMIPLRESDTLMIDETENITRWEVKPHEHTTNFSEKSAG